MPRDIFSFPDPFSAAAKDAVPIAALTEKGFKAWLGAQKDAALKNRIAQAGFKAAPGSVLLHYSGAGTLERVLLGVPAAIGFYDGAPAAERLKKELSADYLKKQSFRFEDKDLGKDDLTRLCIGWGLAAYRFDLYKKDGGKPDPRLCWPAKADRKAVQSYLAAICLTRGLINLPAADLGTQELQAAARKIADTFEASYSAVSGAAIKKGFPMIYAVGHSAPKDRQPALIDFSWGNPKHPRVTIVGKGVVYDTGGLNLKPKTLEIMKKDMGGSAHALGLAWLVMALKLPLCLRVLIPTAENVIGSAAYRPGDIIGSRKGLTVEIGNTDAEGRLVVGDALTYACEDKNKPELLIDFCTLTGHARVALGHDIPAIFSNKDKLANELKDNGMDVGDPVWPLPLWELYLKEMASPVADLNNNGTGPAGAIHGALFLHEFIDKAVPWIHVDCYAWMNGSRPGRSQGGAETGLLAVFKMLEKRYA